MLFSPRQQIVAGCAMMLALALVGCRSGDARMTLTSASAVVRPPYDPTMTQKTVEFWAWKAKLDPLAAIEYGRLAGAYLQRCRETGDVADAIRAEQAARRSLAIRTRNNYAAYDSLALSLLTLHRFREAASVAERCAATRPDDAEATYLDVEARIEMGDYAQAERQLNRLNGAEQDPFSDALRARLCEMEGRPKGALDYLRAAQQQADRNSDLSRPAVAWFHMRRGDVLQAMGRLPEAEAAYHEALALFPRDYKTMTSLSRLASCRHNWQEAIRWGGQAAEIVPAPDTLALLGDAYAAAGRRAEAAQQYQLIEAIADIARAQGAVYDRQRSLYYADHDRHLPEALQLARKELTVRHDVFAYDTLAWAAYKNGRLDEATQAAQRATALGTQDALLIYHAGMIALANGQRQRGYELLSRALAINPCFHPVYADAARAVLSASASLSPGQGVHHHEVTNAQRPNARTPERPTPNTQHLNTRIPEYLTPNAQRPTPASGANS
jgi:tetratricopeptide (TPR) repeat protein